MTLTCDICGSDKGKNGKPFSNQGALNMHKIHCRYKHQDSRGDTHMRLKNTDEKCKHEWRLLNRNDPIENQAFMDQWREVCKKCEELR